MFDDWRKRRELHRRIKLINTRYAPKIEALSWIDSMRLRAERDNELSTPTAQLEALLSKPIIKKAQRIGIEVPDDQSFWNIKTQGAGGYITKLSLNEKGRIKVRNMIQEERRKKIEWWVKVVGPILTIIVSILGLLVAFASLTTKSSGK